MESYLFLAGAIFFGVLAACLEKAGVKIENLVKGEVSLIISALFLIPLNLLSNLGLIVVSVWSLFVLRWYICVLLFFVLSFMAGSLIGSLRRSERWSDFFYSLSIGQIFFRLITAILVVLIFINYLNLR